MLCCTLRIKNHADSCSSAVIFPASESKVVFALIPLGCVALKCYGLI